MRKTVLLVESEQGVRALLRIQLRLLGLTVLEAASGRAGAAAFAAHHQDVAVVVTGELGPPVDGADLLAMGRRAIDGDVPIYFFLGHSLPPEVLGQPQVEVFLKPDGAGRKLRLAIDDLATGAVPAAV